MPKMLLRVVPLLCGLAATGVGASLTVAGQSAVPGQVLVLPVTFSSGGQTISGIQFDLAADPGLEFGVLPGAQIGASAKSLYTASLPNQGFRVLIAGWNGASISDGEALRMVVSVDPSATPGPAALRISNLFATDSDGNPVELEAAAAVIQIPAVTAPSGAPSFTVEGVLNAASLLPGPVSPGEALTIVGSSSLASVSSVLFNGAPAPVLYTGSGQVNTIVPFALSPGTSAELDLMAGTQSLGGVTLTVSSVSPALFADNSSGTGAGVILNQDYSVNSIQNPAPSGSIIVLYGTGFGQVNPTTPDGRPASGPAPTVLPVSASIAGVAAQVLYAGAAPGLVAGVIQINVRLPAGVNLNPAALISLTVGSTAIAPGITVSVQ